ncbi:MAG TPA: hypothetical protein VHA52_05225, partial [Candidatus Babeliaceae bacterium]|nr:hypothetical protein [Candidatus Babeliaceae bacterium]
YLLSSKDLTTAQVNMAKNQASADLTVGVNYLATGVSSLTSLTIEDKNEAAKQILDNLPADVLKEALIKAGRWSVGLLWAKRPDKALTLANPEKLAEIGAQIMKNNPQSILEYLKV